MFKIGCHLSFSGGYAGMVQDSKNIGANVFQFFTRNPRGGKAKPYDPAEINSFNSEAAKIQLGPILAHAPYTMNPCAADENLRVYALETMLDDLMRLSDIPGSMYNFHPGSHVKQGVEVGIKLISELTQKLVMAGYNTTILLETMAGKGSEVGRNFQEIKEIIDRSGGSEKIGVCLDTCHVYDGGYDIRDHLDDVVTEFDNVVGLNRLKAIHLNDSIYGFESHKDRHAKIGEGKLGLEAISRIINHPALRDLPFYLETPNDLDGYAKEIALLKDLRR